MKENMLRSKRKPMIWKKRNSTQEFSAAIFPLPAFYIRTSVGWKQLGWFYEKRKKKSNNFIHVIAVHVVVVEFRIKHLKRRKQTRRVAILLSAIDTFTWIEIHIHIHAIYIYIYMCVCVCVSVCVYVCVYVCLYIYMYVCVCECLLRVYKCVHIYIYRCVCVCVCGLYLYII